MDTKAFYGSAQILFDVNMHVSVGESVGLLGRNGAGKTTTFLSIIHGGPSIDGVIKLFGHDATALRTDAIARNGFVLVPEDRRIFKKLSVRENLSLGVVERGQARISPQSLSEMFPMLAPLLDRRGSELSGGERQLVAVARAIAVRPKVLLLDEPTEGLSPLIVAQMADVIVQLKNDFGITLFIAEQNLPVVLALTDRLYVLEMGKVVYEGPTSEFAKREDLQNRYLSVHGAGHLTGENQ